MKLLYNTRAQFIQNIMTARYYNRYIVPIMIFLDFFICYVDKLILCVIRVVFKNKVVWKQAMLARGDMQTYRVL